MIKFAFKYFPFPNSVFFLLYIIPTLFIIRSYYYMKNCSILIYSLFLYLICYVVVFCSFKYGIKICDKVSEHMSNIKNNYIQNERMLEYKIQIKRNRIIKDYGISESDLPEILRG